MARSYGTVVTGRRAGSMRGKPLQVVGASAIAANLLRISGRIREEMGDATERFGQDVAYLAYQLAPKDTYNLAESITYALSPNRQVVTVFHDPRFFPGEPYHIYQELGFRHAATGEFIQNPHLRPAYRELQPHYAQDIRDGMRRAVSGGGA